MKLLVHIYDSSQFTKLSLIKYFTITHYLLIFLLLFKFVSLSSYFYRSFNSLNVPNDLNIFLEV